MLFCVWLSPGPLIWPWCSPASCKIARCFCHKHVCPWQRLLFANIPLCLVAQPQSRSPPPPHVTGWLVPGWGALGPLCPSPRFVWPCWFFRAPEPLFGPRPFPFWAMVAHQLGMAGLFVGFLLARQGRFTPHPPYALSGPPIPSLQQVLSPPATILGFGLPLIMAAGPPWLPACVWPNVTPMGPPCFWVSPPWPTIVFLLLFWPYVGPTMPTPVPCPTGGGVSPPPGVLFVPLAASVPHNAVPPAYSACKMVAWYPPLVSNAALPLFRGLMRVAFPPLVPIDNKIFPPLP